MKRLLLLSVASLAILLLTTRCYNDNETDLYPYYPCDSTNTTYNKTIAPIMANNCNRCHSTTLATGGIITDNYEALKPLADGGLLWGVVSHAPGFKAMPQNSPKLSDCDLAKIHHWINDGAPNN